MSDTTRQIDLSLRRLQQGEMDALDTLATQAYERVRVIAHRQLQRYPGLVRYVETQDVLHDVLSKLHVKLREKQPEDARDYFRWTSKLIRDHLVDMLRHFYGRKRRKVDEDGEERTVTRYGYDGQAARLESEEFAGQQLSSDTYDAAKIQAMAEFHEAVSRLDTDLRETFDLLFYHGLTQQQAAELTGVSERTVRTRWQKARRDLAQHMPGSIGDAADSDELEE